MRQILLALFLVMFGAAHVGAAPAGLCRHASAETHASALDSADKGEAAIASLEEAAADAKLKSLADRISASMAVGVLPEASMLAAGDVVERPQWSRRRGTPLVSHATQPLLIPPLT